MSGELQLNQQAAAPAPVMAPAPTMAAPYAAAAAPLAPAAPMAAVPAPVAAATRQPTTIVELKQMLSPEDLVSTSIETVLSSVGS